MRKQVFIEQRSPEWLTWRQGKIGASDASTIIGENPWKTPLQLWEEKLLGSSRPVTEAMQRGIDNEDPAREMATKVLGVNYTPACFEHARKGHLISSLDGWCDGQGALEIKCPKLEDHEAAMRGLVPAHYVPQCQMIMMVTDTQYMYYASYLPQNGSLATVLVKRCDDYCERIERAADAFYHKMLEMDPPEPIDRDYTRFFDEKGLAKQRKELHQWIKDAEEELDTLDAAILQQVGSRNAYLGDLRITKSIRKGNVDYKSVPQLEGVDLEPFRKKSTTVWRFS